MYFLNLGVKPFISSVGVTICVIHLDVLVMILESFFGTEGTLFALFTNRRTQFLTPSTAPNSLSGSLVQGLQFFISSDARARARPTCEKNTHRQSNHNKKSSYGSHNVGAVNPFLMRRHRQDMPFIFSTRIR